MSTGLATVRANAKPGTCFFCPRATTHGRVLCGHQRCTRAYQRAWHQDAQREHPERYGRPFYRAKGRLRPDRIRKAPEPFQSVEVYAVPPAPEPEPEPTPPPPRPRTTPIGSVYVPQPARLVVSVAPPAPAVLVPMGLGPDLPPELRHDRPRPKYESAVRLAELRGEVDAETLQAELGVTQDAAHQLLRRLTLDGRLERVRKGLYVVPGEP